MKTIPCVPYPARGGMVALAVAFRDAVDALEQGVATSEAEFARLKKSGDFLMDWHRRVNNPYRHELEGLYQLGLLVYPMNGALEFGCSTAFPMPHKEPTLWRTLDWPWPNMAEGLLVVEMPSSHGPWLNVTWPNFVGVANAMAPGRFALAVNKAPSWFEVNPTVHRQRLLRSKDLSPLHLAREVMEHAPDFATAKQWLLSRRLCTTAIFSLVGTKPGETAVIEHWAQKALEVPQAVAATNHWQAFPPNRVKPLLASKERLRAMKQNLELRYLAELGWLRPPVLFEHTVLAMEASPARGVLKVRGVNQGKVISRFNGVFGAA